jgi:hypothetical protein
MKYIQDSDLWYTLQVYFKNNIMPNLVNDDKVWAHEFRRWLKEQGAEIEQSPYRLVRNSLGIAPHYDRLFFENEQRLAWFVLRWS